MKTVIFQEHASVLPEWKQREIQGITLIYLDAHIDLQFVSQERITALKNCKSADELSQFEKPHHMLPDLGYGFSIEDFLYPAYCLGIVSHLIWVTPPGKDAENKEPKIQEILNRLSMMEGVSLEDLASFEQVDNIVTGKILGLDVTICGHHNLAQLQIPSNSLIDIDIDYFIALPADEPWIDPQTVFASLQQLHLTSDFVTLTRSVSSGYMPLRYSFFADYLAALWQEDHQQSEHYARLFQYDQQWRQGKQEAAKSGFRQEVQNFPHCAATHYFLSIVESNSDIAQHHAIQAISLNSLYSPSILRSISELASRDLVFESAQLQSLESQLETSTMNQEELAIAHFTLGLLYSKLNDLHNVFKHHISYKKLLPRHPQLNLRLGGMLLKAGYPQRAAAFLRAALQDEMSACGAHSLLGRICVKQGDLQQASEHFLKVCNMMPAFSQPVTVLAKIYKKMGDDLKAEAMHKKYQQMQFSSAIIAQKLKN